jgi:GNAT superfamily N-acetyltransferase
MPNLAEGFRKAKGRLFPFGFIHLIKCLKSSKKLDLLLGAVHPKHQGKGLTALLAVALMEEASKAGMAKLDSHLILEENKLMCAEMTRMGAGLTKRYRIFQKSL